MSTTYTPNAKLGKPAAGDRSWGTVRNANMDALDAIAPLAGLMVTADAVGGTTLVIDVAAGKFLTAARTEVSYGGGTLTLTASATNSVYLTDSGTLTNSTSGFPASTNLVKLATVVTGASSITSITDARDVFSSFGGTFGFIALAGGTLNDGANLAVGTSTGTQIATAATQKLGFYGATAVVRPSGANEAAIGSLTTVTLTDSTGGTVSTTLAAITAGSSYAQADMVAAKNAIASINAQITNAVADFATVKTLVNQLRSDLVTLGLIKGSA
jgi:hypothetical protein